MRHLCQKRHSFARTVLFASFMLLLFMLAGCSAEKTTIALTREHVPPAAGVEQTMFPVSDNAMKLLEQSETLRSNWNNKTLLSFSLTRMITEEKLCTLSFSEITRGLKALDSLTSDAQNSSLTQANHQALSKALERTHERMQPIPPARMSGLSLSFSEDMASVDIQWNKNTLILNGAFTGEAYLCNLWEDSTEIALTARSANGSLKTHFVHLANRPMNMGSVPGDPKDLHLAGQGIIITQGASKLSPKWQVTQIYQGDVVLRREYVHGLQPIFQQITAQKPITLLDCPEGQEGHTIPVGASIVLLGSDDEQWISILTETGTIGWLEFDSTTGLTTTGESLMELLS